MIFTICLKSLNDLGFAEYWLNQAVLSPRHFKNIVKNRIKDQFLQNWKDMLNNSSKCSTYKIFKTDFVNENYLKLLPKNLAISLCRFRCSSHKLPIEKGRFTSIAHNLRYCSLCNNNSLGDEFHYIFECPHFMAERKKYIPMNLRRANMLNLERLFSSEDRTTLVKLAVFVQKIMAVFS